MDIERIEADYANLRQAFDAGDITATAFQAAVEALRVQDDDGCYWSIGSETGTWYYFAGDEWVAADPRTVDRLTLTDEAGVVWRLHRKRSEWRYYNGTDWVKPLTETALVEIVSSTAPALANSEEDALSGPMMAPARETPQPVREALLSENDSPPIFLIKAIIFILILVLGVTLGLVISFIGSLS